MKKLLLILSIILLVVFSVSCKKDNAESGDDIKNGDGVKNVDGVVYTDEEISALREKLLEAPLFSESLVYQSDVSEDGSREAFDEFYLDYYFYSGTALLDSVTSYAFITSSTTDLCEVGIFKTDSEEAQEALLSAFKKRQENQAQIYLPYSAKDVEIAEGMKTGTDGNLVWFVMTPDNDSVEKIITSFK